MLPQGKGAMSPTLLFAHSIWLNVQQYPSQKPYSLFYIIEHKNCQNACVYLVLYFTDHHTSLVIKFYLLLKRKKSKVKFTRISIII